MPITAEQREARRLSIGSSDAAAILGLDPWKSPQAVWTEKVYATDDLRGKEHIEIGNEHEHAMIGWCGKQLGRDWLSNVRCRHANGLMVANIDALVIPEQRTGPLTVPMGDGVIEFEDLQPAGIFREAIEAKTGFGQDYGEEGTDQVPDRVVIQVHFQMACLPTLERVWVPLLTSEYDRLRRKLYVVERNDDLIDVLSERMLAFWRDHVEAELPPLDGDPPPMELLSRIRRVPNKIEDVDPELAEAYRIASEAAKEATKLKESAKQRLLAAAGDAEAMDFGDPDWIYTYLEYNRKGIDAARIRRTRPDLVKEFGTESTYRQLKKVKRS